MKLSEFAQLANNTLGIVDTGKNLLTTPQGNGPVSALSQQINNVFAAITSEVHDVRDVLQRDLGTVNSMVANVQVQQTVLRQEINEVLQGVTASNTLMKKHMNVVEDQLHFIIDEPLQNACYQLTAHLTNKEGVAATDEELRLWLRMLQTWIDKAGKRKTLAMSLEQAVQSLSQSPDNIYLIALCMQLLFGKILPEKYLSLPSVSIKFYFTVINSYLKGLEKNPHLMGEDKAQSICQEIKNTLDMYLDFSKFLNDNPKVVQALFDRHDYLFTRNAASAQMLRVILKNVVPLLGNVIFTEKLATLEKSGSQLASVNSNADIWDNLPTEPHERVRRIFFLLSQDNPPTAAHTKYMLLPEGAAYTPIPNQINWATHGAPNSSSTSSWGCSYFPNQPKPPAFVSASVLFLLLAAGYADANYFKNFTLKKQVALLLAACPSTTGSHRTEISRESWEVDSCHDSNHATVYENPRLSNRAFYGTGDYTFLFGNAAHSVSITHHPARYTTTSYTPNASVYGGHRANIFEYHAKLSDTLPTEFEALLANSAPSYLTKNKIFKYYLLYSQGQFAEADAFIRQEQFTQEYEKSYMLFLVAIVGRWDIFEAFNKIHPIAHYNWTLTGTAISPSSLSKQYGHDDVVAGLSSKTLWRFVTSDYEHALKEIQKSASAIKTKLDQYVPASPLAQRVVLSAQVADPLSDEETSDEMEEKLEKTTSEFFTKHNRHIGRTSFWKRPTQRKYQRMGFRVINNDEFENDDQRNTFFGNLDTGRIFKISSLKTEKQLLVKLPPMQP